MYTLEVIASTPRDVIVAQESGANRIELVSGLSEGGLTPSLGLIEQVLRVAKIPVMVMIRPRGGDFCYDDHELKVMEKDIEIVRNLGLEGIVLGALTMNNTVNIEALQRLIGFASGLDITFHRAFDMAVDISHTVNSLRLLGVKRVLTSGQAANSMLGINKLKELQEKYEDMLFMPGVGLSSDNLKEFLSQISRVREVHLGLGLRKEGDPLHPLDGDLTQKAKQILDSITLQRDTFHLMK